MKRLGVVKFGGTCLVDEGCREKAAGYCRELLGEYARLIVVVSAMGRKGDPYSTDTLKALAGSPMPFELDMLLACGENISAVVMAEELRKMDLDAIALSGWAAGIETDGVHCQSEISRIHTGMLAKMLEDHNCAVVAGFQGADADGNVTTIGRGGSDVTALALAAAMDADDVILYKTVDSVYTADPERVAGAMEISRMSAEDLRQMAWHGAKIVHPRAAEIALESGKRISLRSHETGERVTDIEPYVLQSGRYIMGVTSGPEVVQFCVDGDMEVPSGEFFARVFRKVADEGISMDMFSVFGRRAVFTVSMASREHVVRILEETGIRYSSISPCVKVSIVGAGMHGLQGVMARFSESLARAGVEMLQTVDSHATISALVHGDDCGKALEGLHREFVEK